MPTALIVSRETQVLPGGYPRCALPRLVSLRRKFCEDFRGPTPNLGLPYSLAAQSQKHVTHNEAIRALDAIVQLSVLDRDLAAANGARYIVAVSPKGAWSGHAGDIAAYQDGAWAFYDPVEASSPGSQMRTPP